MVELVGDDLVTDRARRRAQELLAVAVDLLQVGLDAARAAASIMASIARAGMINRPRMRMAGNSPSRMARYRVTGAIPIMRAASGTL